MVWLQVTAAQVSSHDDSMPKMFTISSFTIYIFESYLIIKGIKKIEKIGIWFLVTVIVLLLSLNLLLNISILQNWLVHRVASFYSLKLKTKVVVGKIDFELFKTFVFHDVLIEDKHSDTLLYTSELKLDLGSVNIKKRKIFFSDIILDRADVHLCTYKGEKSLNLQFILNSFASKDTTKTQGWDVGLGKIILADVNVTFVNQNDSSCTTGINFSDLNIKNINAVISDIRFPEGTLRADIENFSAIEKSGFILKRLSCFVKLSSKGMELDALRIETAHTLLSTDLFLVYNRYSDFNDFVHNVVMHAVFRESAIGLSDIACFAPGLYGTDNTFTLSGEYEGTINNLKAKKMNISWGKLSTLEGDAVIKGLPGIDSTFITLKIERLITSKGDIETFPVPPFNQHNKLKLPENIGYLKTIDLNGSFEGYISDFNAIGNVSTNLGKISASLHLNQRNKENRVTYKGEINTTSFDLGRFWGIPDLGVVTASISLEGEGLKTTNTDARISGTIRTLDFKKYSYSNITLNGEFKKGFFSGLADIDVPELKANFNGEINIGTGIHSYSFSSSVSRANLTALHFTGDSASPAYLTTSFHVDLKGNTFDSITGNIKIDSTTFRLGNENYHVNSLILTTALNGTTRTIDESSDYADLKMSGNYHFGTIYPALRNFIQSYISPNAKEEKKTGLIKNALTEYSYEIHFNENTHISDLFVPTLKIAEGSIIKGSFNDRQHVAILQITAPYIEWKNKKMTLPDFNISGNKDKINFKGTMDTLFLNDSIYAMNYMLAGTLFKDTIKFETGWVNDSSNYVSIPGYIIFLGNSTERIELIHPVIKIVDTIWTVNPANSIVIDTSGISVHNLIFSHGSESYFAINGKYSERKTDTIGFRFHHFNLAYLNTKNSNLLSGVADGNFFFTLEKKRIYLLTSLKFKNLSLNRQFIGDGNITSVWNDTSSAFDLSGNFENPQFKLFSFSGSFSPLKSADNLNITISLNHLPLKLFEPYTTDICSDMNGYIEGIATLKGNMDKPLLEGTITIKIQQIKVDYLNTFYHSPAFNVTLVRDTVKLKPSLLLDANGDTSIAKGNLYHNEFKDLRLNFAVLAKKLQFLNTTENMNGQYYGKCFATGNVLIYGIPSSIHFDADVTTEKGTNFNISLANATEVGESDFIQFGNKHKKQKKHEEYKVKLSGIQVNFNIKATNDAEAKIIFAPTVGDELTGSGNGNIQVVMNNHGEISMYGNYTVSSGSYNFTLRNTFSKYFKIQQGSTIDWNGDPFNADVNINAVYSLRTSLEPLFPDDVTGQYQKRYPVDCSMNLTGKLISPDINFAINLPTVDENTRELVQSIVTSNNQLNTQVFSLLVLGSFNPVQSNNNIGITPTGVAGNSLDFLLNQFNSWLSGPNSTHSIGLNYQPGTTTNPTELRVEYSQELFNGKATITTDAGTMSTAQAENTNANNLVGEFTIEYRVGKGKLKVKAYNKANDFITQALLNAPYTQGAGLVFSEGFNSWGELWGKIKNWFRHKPEEKNTK